MSSLYDKIIQYANNARESLIDKYSSTAGGAGAGKATWVGYDSQGRAIVKQQGVIKVVTVEGRISLPPGATVIVDNNGVVSVRQASEPVKKKRTKKPEQKTPRVPKKNRPVILSAVTQEAIVIDEEEETKVYGIDFSLAIPKLDSEVNFLQQFTRYILDFLLENFAPYDNPTVIYQNTEEVLDYNLFRKRDIFYRPTFGQDLPTSRRFWLGPAYEINNQLLELDWLFNQSSSNFGFSVVTEQKPVLPELPIDLTEMTVVDETVYVKSDYQEGTQRTFTSCDGTYIYHSRLLRTVHPTSLIYRGIRGFYEDIRDPEFYEYFDIDIAYFSNSRTRYYNAQKWTPRLSYTDFKNSYPSGVRPGVSDSQIFEIYGLYWRFNARTEEDPIFEARLIDYKYNQFTTEEHNAAVDLFLKSMYPLDPISRLYRESVGQTLEGKLDEFMFEPYGFLNRWYPGLVYDEERGWLTLVTTPFGLDTPRIFSRPLPELTHSFNAIPAFYLPNKLEPLATIEDYEALGWTLEGPIQENTLSPLDQYFAFKPKSFEVPPPPPEP